VVLANVDRLKEMFDGGERVAVTGWLCQKFRLWFLCPQSVFRTKIAVLQPLQGTEKWIQFHEFSS